jgi:hypothetical protein
MDVEYDGGSGLCSVDGKPGASSAIIQAALAPTIPTPTIRCRSSSLSVGLDGLHRKSAGAADLVSLPDQTDHIRLRLIRIPLNPEPESNPLSRLHRHILVSALKCRLPVRRLILHPNTPTLHRKGKKENVIRPSCKSLNNVDIL